MIKIYTRENCSNCKKVKEILATLDYEVVEINADENRDEVDIYAPRTQWNLPLITYWQGNDLVNVTTGIVDKEKIELAFTDLEKLQSMAYRTARTLHTLSEQYKTIELNSQFIEKIIGFKEIIQNPTTKPLADNFPATLEDPCESCA